MTRLFFLWMLVTIATPISAQEYSQNLVIHKNLPAFEIYLVFENPEERTAFHFEIVDKETKKLFQKSTVFKARNDYATVEFMDLNFDGYMDLQIAANPDDIPADTSSYHGSNEIVSVSSSQQQERGNKHCWLYNPKKKIYEYNISISNISNVYADNEKKQLISNEYTLYAHCQSSVTTYYYAIKNGKAYCVNTTYSHSNSNPNEPPIEDLNLIQEPENPFKDPKK